MEKYNILCIYTQKIGKLCLEEYCVFSLELKHMINWLKDKIMIESLLIIEKDYLKHVVKFPSVMRSHEVNTSPKNV